MLTIPNVGRGMIGTTLKKGIVVGLLLSIILGLSPLTSAKITTAPASMDVNFRYSYYGRIDNLTITDNYVNFSSVNLFFSTKAHMDKMNFIVFGHFKKGEQIQMEGKNNFKGFIGKSFILGRFNYSFSNMKMDLLSQPSVLKRFMIGKISNLTIEGGYHNFTAVNIYAATLFNEGDGSWSIGIAHDWRSLTYSYNESSWNFKGLLSKNFICGRFNEDSNTTKIESRSWEWPVN